MDKINITILKSTYEELKSIKKWYNRTNRTNIPYKALIGHIIHEYIRFKGLSYIYNTDKDLIEYECKMYRIDPNLKPTTKEVFDAIHEHIEEQTKSKKNLDYIALVIALSYLEQHPEIKERLEKDKLIKLKELIEKAKEDGILPSRMNVR